MSDPEQTMAEFVAEQLERFPAEDIRRHLLAEGHDAAEVDAALAEALRLRGGAPPSGFGVKLAAVVAVFVVGMSLLSVRFSSMFKRAPESLAPGAQLSIDDPSLQLAGKAALPTPPSASAPSPQAAPAKASPGPIEALRARAEAGDLDAQEELGERHFGGRGVPANLKESVAWYTRAAEGGHAGARRALAYMYLGGRGIEPDGVEAYRWFSLLAQKGDADAKRYLGEIEKMLPADQLAEAKRRAAASRK